MNQKSTRIEAISKPGAILSPSQTSCFPLPYSPRLCTKKDLFVATSLQSSSPSEKKVESSGKSIVFENNNMYGDCGCIYSSFGFLLVDLILMQFMSLLSGVTSVLILFVIFYFLFPDMWRHHLGGVWNPLRLGNHLGLLTILYLAPELILI